MLREKGFYWLYVRQAFCRTYHLSVQQSKRKKCPVYYSVHLFIHSQIIIIHLNIQCCYLLLLFCFVFVFFIVFLSLSSLFSSSVHVSIPKPYKSMEKMYSCFKNSKNRITLSQCLIIKINRVPIVIKAVPKAQANKQTI